MDGELVYLFVYSAGARFTEEQLKDLLKNPEDFSKYEDTKPAPEEIATFNIPSIFNLKGETLTVKDKKYNFKVQASVYTLGSFSIRMRCAFSGVEEGFLNALGFDKEVNEFAKHTAEKVCATVIKNLAKIKEVKLNPNSETYRFYYLQGEQQALLKKYGKLIAGLMVDESDYGLLDDSYVSEVLGKRISYNDTDVFLAGWESSVLIDRANAYEHELLIAEIANVQLLETRVYHEIAAEKLRETDYVANEVSASKLLWRRGRFKKANVTLGEFYDNAQDMISRVNDTVVSFGEWYLSKLYSLFESVFKLDSWRGMIEKDLEAIEKRRDFLSEVMRWRTEQVMEIILIILTIIDLVLVVGLR
jgi:hypothetical protein